MAWNEIAFKDDLVVQFQAYYVRLNALRQFMKPLTQVVFEKVWDLPGDDRKIFRRTALVGEFVADLVRTLGMEDAARRTPRVGEWFVHSGVTRHSVKRGVQTAQIQLTDGSIVGDTIRPEYRLASTAATNMSGNDDISTVIGRRLSDTRFDLVCAGYRDPYAYWSLQAEGVSIKEMSSGKVLNAKWRDSLYPKMMPQVQMHDNRTISSADVLRLAVRDGIRQFGFVVEQSGAWRLLYERDGQIVHETAHQKLFEVSSRLLFSALRINVYPHVDTGRGAVDLLLELDGSRHVVELKKDSSGSSMRHGLKIQLPAYLESADAVHGTYLVLCHTYDPSKVLKLLEGHAPDGIDVEVVDCRKRPSASVA